MRSTICKLLLLLCIPVLSVQSQAGTVEGKVTMIQIGFGYTADNVYALVKFDVTATNQPSCATDNTRFAVNPATEGGKAMLAALLTAKATQATVEIIGTDSCNVMGSSQESVSYMRLK